MIRSIKVIFRSVFS